MSFESILNLLILVMLGVTIVYAARLSIYLKSFRDGRKDMDFLLQELSSSVARAENAIRDMNASADQSGLKLQDVIKDAKFLSDELRFMTEAGDNLADKLEKLADRNRELVTLLEQAGGVGHPGSHFLQEKPPPDKSVKPVKQEKPAGGGFLIQDRDYDDYDDYGDYEDEMESEEGYGREDEDVFELTNPVQARPQSHSQPSLKSQAEKELYEALRRRPAGAGKKRMGTPS